MPEGFLSLPSGKKWNGNGVAFGLLGDIGRMVRIGSDIEVERKELGGLMQGEGDSGDAGYSRRG